MLELAEIVEDFAKSLVAADGRHPIALNQRSKEAFQAGIGPHSEAEAIRLALDEARAFRPSDYSAAQVGVRYPNEARQRCDLCLGSAPDWDWAVEAKLLRFLGDNGQPNDNMLMHILSPYPAHRSALTDSNKLRRASLGKRNAVLIFGFEAEGWPLDPAIDAFEVLARARGAVGPRCVASFRGLVHPVHRAGRVFAWELLP